MNQGININITDGIASIGAVSQGDHGHVVGNATLSQGSIQQEAQRAESAITLLARERRCSPQELQTVLAHLNSLVSASEAATKDDQKGGHLLKLVRENFSWAYPAIKDFANLVWPAILTAIET
jgi:hypothetical protein